jgi:hypothetical protein
MLICHPIQQQSDLVPKRSSMLRGSIQAFHFHRKNKPCPVPSYICELAKKTLGRVKDEMDGLL